MTTRVLQSDMTIVRVLLGLASGLCALALWMGWESYNRLAFGEMPLYISANKLGTLYFLHFIGVVWRLFGKDSRSWGLAVNSLGFVLFAWLGITVDLSLGLLTLTSTVVLTMALASFWAIVRTGNGIELVSP